MTRPRCRHAKKSRYGFLKNLLKGFTPTPVPTSRRDGVSSAGAKRGFTLIELLVVIGIIGILSVIVLVSLSSSRAKARDAKRVADVREYVSALEVYYNAEGGYPDGTDLVLDGESLCEEGSTPGWTDDPCDADQNSLIKTAAAPLPADNPGGDTTCDETTNSYTYTQLSGTGYDLTFCIGGVIGEFDPGICTATEEGIICS